MTERVLSSAGVGLIGWGHGDVGIEFDGLYGSWVQPRVRWGRMGMKLVLDGAGMF